MSRYNPGNVLLVPFPFDGESGAKLRPALVIALDPRGDLVCCAIRSSPRAGTPCVPIGIDDFDSGGLDLFSESYVQVDTARAVRTGTVVGKKGTVRPEFLKKIIPLVRHT